MDEIERTRYKGFTPYMYYEDAEAALTWLADKLGFEEVVRYVGPDGRVQESEMLAGDTLLMISGMGPGYWQEKGQTGPTGQLFILYVDDVDAHWEQLRRAGLDVGPPEDKPYGARLFSVTDIGGYAWTFWQTTSESVELEEGWQEIRSSSASGA
jgi:uncharacterized glyoxalase superfamily protein PhnB